MQSNNDQVNNNQTESFETLELQLKDKDAFTNFLCHEMLTPLTALRGFAYLLEKQFGQKVSDPMFLELIHDLDQGFIHLINTVNEFRDVFHIEQGRVKYRKDSFSIVPLLHEVFLQVHERLQEKDLGYEVQDQASGTLVSADHEFTKKVFTHLIENAIQFSNQGKILVQVSIESPYVRVRIQDNGIGIEATRQSKVFEKPEKTPDGVYTKSSPYGPGLGLYISKHLVEGMGGKLELTESVVGSGSVFTVMLPISG